MKNIEVFKTDLEYRLYTPYDYFSITHYRKHVERGNTKIIPHNQHYQDKFPNQNDFSIGDIISLNLHFGCSIRPEQFSRYMEYYELNIYHEMKQLDVKETKISELSFLLFPFRVFIEVFEDVEDLYPYIAGEYRKVPGENLKKISYDIKHWGNFKKRHRIFH